MNEFYHENEILYNNYFKQAPWTLIFSRDEEGKIHHAQLSFIRRSYTIVRK